MYSFLSEMYPGVALSKNTVSDLFKRVGAADNRIRRLMDIRIAQMGRRSHPSTAP